MKKEKIKALPVVIKYVEYFVRRAKRVLGLTNSEYNEYHVDLINSEDVEVWFFKKTGIVAQVKFTADGRKKDTMDRRAKCKRKQPTWKKLKHRL